jgi:hypothetical protein
MPAGEGTASPSGTDSTTEKIQYRHSVWQRVWYSQKKVKYSDYLEHYIEGHKILCQFSQTQ